jgi:hypothetical protein
MGQNSGMEMRLQYGIDYNMVYNILCLWKIEPPRERIICRDARAKFSIVWSAYT